MLSSLNFSRPSFPFETAAPETDLLPARKVEEIQTTPEAAEADEASLAAAYESALQPEVVDNSDNSYPFVEAPLAETKEVLPADDATFCVEGVTESTGSTIVAAYPVNPGVSKQLSVLLYSYKEK